MVAAGLLAPLAVVAPASALPGECRLETRWQSDGGHYDDAGSYVETGIRPVSSVVCDVIEDRWTGGGGGEHPGGGGSDPGVPAPPEPPGPLFPAPPPSSPAAAAPPCVAGSNNSSDPGRGGSGQTGSGENLLATLEPMLERGDLTIDRTSPSRIVSIDVNLGPSVGGATEVNPLEGMSPEEAARAMYWPGAYDPTYTEVGARGRLIVQAVKFLFRSTMGDRSALRGFHIIMRNSSPEIRMGVWDMVQKQAVHLNEQYKGNIPPNIRSMLEEAVGVLFDLLESGPIGGPDPSGASDYLRASTEGAALGAGATGGVRGYGANKGVCGQIAQTTVSPSATLVAGGPWVRITLRSAAYGTLVDRIKALRAPTVHCAPVHATVTAGQATMVDATGGCSGPVSSRRVLTRFEISRLPRAVQTRLLDSSDADPTAGSIFQFDWSRWDHPEPWPTPSSTATFADGHVGFTGFGGAMNYQAPLAAGGRDDHVVVGATDASGVEHVFLVTVTIVAQPACSGTDRPAGPERAGFRPVVQDGSLQLIRNRPFTLDPSVFCTADPRTSYRVTVAGAVPGTIATARPDGSIDVDWTDPDVVGAEVAGLTFTAWDESTGVPSAPVTIPVTVRDVPPACADVSVVYDRSDNRGEPLLIPTSCGMLGGLAVLDPPFLALSGGSSAPLAADVAGGVVRSDGRVLTFTPDGTTPADGTAMVVPWTVDPRSYTPYRVHGAAFTVRITLAD
ncbi:hypothetical protein GCM10017602_26290 [Herbiconiux flava]|nr:hypothetical protein GCM10017602_26290 [Herbiconiux flava]